MKSLKRVIVVLALVGGSFAVLVGPASAGSLPEGCRKEKGTVTCTTFDGPGKNQAGVGTTQTQETQGNTTNTSPEPQDLESDTSCNPPSSKGRPCNP